MPEVPTDVRASVRVLLRGLPKSEGAKRSIEGYVVLITGPARPSRWPEVALEEGDLEGVVWTTPRQAPRVQENLVKSACVVSTLAPPPRDDDDELPQAKS